MLRISLFPANMSFVVQASRHTAEVGENRRSVRTWCGRSPTLPVVLDSTERPARHDSIPEDVTALRVKGHDSESHPLGWRCHGCPDKEYNCQTSQCPSEPGVSSRREIGCSPREEKYGGVPNCAYDSWGDRESALPRRIINVEMSMDRYREYTHGHN